MSRACTCAMSSARWHATSARSLDAWSGAAMRRSRMPVRSTIHSSDVSTSFARSWFVSTRSGTYMPVPVMVTPRMPSGRRVMVGLDLLANVLVDALLHERGERADRAAERARAARAVPDEAHAVHAQERRGAVFLPVDARAQPVERPAHEQRPEHRQRVALHLVAHGATEEARRALGGLQEHVAGEAVGDDDVARALEQVATLDRTDEVEVARRLDQRQRLLDQLVALALLLADREQSHPRVLVPEQVAREAGPHVGELHQPRRLHLG